MNIMNKIQKLIIQQKQLISMNMIKIQTLEGVLAIGEANKKTFPTTNLLPQFEQCRIRFE